LQSPQPIYLNYDGGSGGFFALWLVLLGTDYRCKFESNESLDKIFNKQWTIDGLWKDSEVWPDNQRTKESDLKQKIYFTCMPELSEIKLHLGTTVAVYTDIKTQNALCRYKNANHFYDNHGLKLQFKNMYRNVRDDSWPDKLNIENFNTLDTHIQDELNNIVDESFSGFNNVNEVIKTIENYNPMTESKKYKNIYVSVRALEIINNCDIAVSWQDLIQTKGQCLFSELGYSTNKQCSDFVNTYVKLHPPYIMEEHE